jgi:hypothetical protein
MALTVTEKEHWVGRISRRIDKRIETLEAADPSLKKRIQRDARQQAFVSLGLADWQDELDKIERDKEALEKRTEVVTRAMLAHVRGVPVSDLDDSVYSYHCRDEVRSAVSKRQNIHEDELLAESETGREILRLREEKENLLDTIWLATSPSQLKTLWTKVSELLGTEPTQLEREALAIPAVGASGEK